MHQWTVNQSQVQSVSGEQLAGTCAQPFELVDGTVHAWYLDLDHPPIDAARLAQTLSADEVKRATAFQFEQLRLRFVVGRGLLRVLLANYVGAVPETIVFTYGSQSA